LSRSAFHLTYNQTWRNPLVCSTARKLPSRPRKTHYKDDQKSAGSG